MLRVALTGSIGMGKSTTLGFFREAGIPVYSADETVHKLYAGKAAPLVETAFPGTVENGTVNRLLLSAKVLGNDAAMKRLESIIHPLVHEEEQAFAKAAAQAGARLAVFDIPLLFETGRETEFDCVIVVSAPSAVQRERVLARPGMNETRFESILARQMPDSQKRARADFIVDTGSGLEKARAETARIIRELTADSAN